MRSTVDRDFESGGRASARGGGGSSEMAWELLGAVSQFRNDVERYKWYLSSISTIRFLAILNVTYSLVGMTFLVLAQFPPNEWHAQRMQFLQLGMSISFFSPVALLADLLALRGLRKWKRVCLLPWLVVYAVMLGLAFAMFVSEIYHRGIRWHILLLGACTMIVFSRWRHVGVQYKLMVLYPEQPPSQQAIDGLAGEIRVVAASAVADAAAAAASGAGDKDLPPPPKYEDLEQPPQYDEEMARVVDVRAEIVAIRNKVEEGAATQEEKDKLGHLQAKLATLEVDGGRNEQQQQQQPPSTV